MQTEARKLHPNLSWRVPIRLRSFNRPKAFSSFPVKALAEAEWLSSVAAVRKDWPGSAILQPPTQLGAVIGLVAEALRCCGDEPFRGTVIRIDGCIGTTLLYHFLATIDYAHGELVLRRKTAKNLMQFVAASSGKSVAVPFWIFCGRSSDPRLVGRLASESTAAEAAINEVTYLRPPVTLMPLSRRSLFTTIGDQICGATSELYASAFGMTPSN
jgi:hypothetical protein